MNVAIVHEWLVTLGGSERVVMALHRMFPEAPIFTSVHDAARLGPACAGLDVRTSFLQRWPGARRHHQALLPFLPLAVEEHDLRGFDVVISSHHCVAQGAITDADALHLAYVHTPMRYAWDMTHEYQATLGRWQRPLAAPLLTYLRAWDVAASLRVDHHIANSREVAGRIAKHYRRSATVIPPPIRVAEFPVAAAPPDDAPYMVVSRLVPYKRVDLAILAAKEAGRRLVVVGEGPEYGRLRGLAGPGVTFTGQLPDADVVKALAGCRALLFCGHEDFGLVPLEAIASGRPVVAFGRGGATETVVDGETGVFFHDADPRAIAGAMATLEARAWDPLALRAHAAGFDEAVFAARLHGLIDSLFGQFRAGVPTARFVYPEPAARVTR